MKRMTNTISLHGNPIFDALSRKHYPQILQIGNEQGDLPIVEILGPSAYEEGGQYYANDANSSQTESTDFASRRDSRSDEATETEIVLESLLSLGASKAAVEFEQFKYQISMFRDVSSMSTPDSDSHSLTRSERAFAPNQNIHFNGAVPGHFQDRLDIQSRGFLDEPFFMPYNGDYYSTHSVVHRSLPPIAPPGISTDNERKFLHHYLHVISARITSPDRGRNNPFRNAFARLATDFPPLLHGILAISATDLSRYDRNISSYEAFVHYQGCVSMLATSLNEPSAVVADEALATICLLFLHEVIFQP
jgi:Fungal specific transcription factor domain